MEICVCICMSTVSANLCVCVSLAASPARTDSSVATDGNEDTASVISWADRCGKFEHQTVAWHGLAWPAFASF